MDTGTHHLTELLVRDGRTRRSPRIAERYTRESLLLRLNAEDSRRNRPISADESKFLQRWAPLLPPERWASFLIPWLRRLRECGGEPSLVDECSFTFTTRTFFGESVHAIDARGALSKAARDQIIKSLPPLSFLQPLEHYQHELASHCRLCHTVASEADYHTTAGAYGSRSLLNLNTHGLFPNRFPAAPGGSLFLACAHDHTTSRTQRTRGKLVTAADLTKLIALCDALELVAMKNHAADGMSIPDHDHTHLFPADLIPEAYVRTIVGPHFGMPLLEAKGTPLATLVISGAHADEIATTAAPILSRLELTGEIFTYAYAHRQFLVSARRSSLIDHHGIQLGCGTPLHFFNPSVPSLQETVERYCPRRGEFDWGRFLN